MSRSQKTSLDIDNENELDTTIVFKEQATGLGNVRNMDEALDKFGYTKNDKINRRELVEIYKKVEKDINNDILNLSLKNKYKEIKEKKNNEHKIYDEFSSQQINTVKKNQIKQKELFQLGETLLTDKTNEENNKIKNELISTIDERNQLNNLYKDIETSQLLSSIKSLKKPKMKYSKTIINLLHMENNLNKLEQYDDAIKVRLKINELLPKETKKFYEKFNQDIEKQIKNLEIKQERDQRKLEENNIGRIWKNKREEENINNM